MPDSLLRFSNVVAGREVLGGVQVYYAGFYVGKISHSCGIWSARLHDILLGEFAALDDARRAVAEWYYGPRSGSSDPALSRR